MESNKNENEFPRSTFSENLNLLTDEEKLELVKKEVQTLYDFCTSKGFSEKDMSSCLVPFSGNPPEKTIRACKSNVRFLFGVAIVIGLVAVVAYTDVAYNVFCIHGKIAIMQVLPYWNWTYIWNEECFLENKFFKPQENITEEDCRGCAELCSSIKNGTGSVEFLKNVSYDDISQNFLYANFPGIIEDGLKGWPNPNITLPYLHQIYTTDHRLSNLTECKFNSSIPEQKSPHDFFKAYGEHSLPQNWYAEWLNCQNDAAKVLRVHYKRPYFLPPMAEVAKNNRIILGIGRFKEAFEAEDTFGEMHSGAVVTVLSGKLNFTLEPLEDCQQFGCFNVSFSVGPGQAALVPLSLWKMHYAPDADNLTLAIGISARWN